jgi:uncharacterized membrane protein
MRADLVLAARAVWQGWGWGASGGWSWLWPVWLIVAVLFWAGLISLVVWAIRAGSASRRPVNQATMMHEQSIETLRRRLAAGQISVEEYEHIRSLLSEE